jgi:hypothetical protein
LEADPDGWYCYTAMAFVRDRLLVAYCAGDEKVGGLNRLRVRALERELLTSPDGASQPARPQRFFQSKDARLHYVDEGSGVPVVLIHGFANISPVGLPEEFERDDCTQSLNDGGEVLQWIESLMD